MGHHPIPSSGACEFHRGIPNFEADLAEDDPVIKKHQSDSIYVVKLVKPKAISNPTAYCISFQHSVAKL
jgi:hypothetical protein